MNHFPVFGFRKAPGKILRVLVICGLLGWNSLSLRAMSPPHMDYAAKSVQELLDLCDNKDAGIRGYAATYIGWRYADPHSPFFGLPDAPMAGPANGLALELPIPDAVIPKLHALLKSDPVVEVKCSALGALAYLRFRTNTTPLIIEALSDDSVLVRFYAAESLGDISEKYQEKLPDAVIPTLIACLSSNSKPDIRLQAANVLGVILGRQHEKLPDAAVPILLESLNPSQPFYAIREAINQISSMGATGQPLIPAMEKLESHSDDRVRKLASEALDKIKKGLPPVTAAEAMAAEPYLTLAKKGATQAELASAMGNLSLRPVETPEFWSQIANDPAYSAIQRRLAVDELFQRQVKAAISLADLVGLLNHPTWINADSIKKVDAVGVHNPLDKNADDTIFALDVLSGEKSDPLDLYVRVHGKIDEQGFKDLLTGKEPTTAGNAIIDEIGRVNETFPAAGGGWVKVRTPSEPNPNPVIATEPYFTVAKKDATTAELTAAVSLLRMPPLETPEFWSRIANDPDYPVLLRRLAVDSLFFRQINLGMNLSAMMDALNHPNWINARSIKIVTRTNGFSLEGDSVYDTIFAFNARFPAGTEKGQLLIYLRVQGKIDVPTLRSFLSGNGPTTIGNALVVQIGCVDDSFPTNNGPGPGWSKEYDYSTMPPEPLPPAPPSATNDVTATQPYYSFARKGATKAEIAAAVDTFNFVYNTAYSQGHAPAAPLETPEFWSRIANDPEYPDFQRRVAVGQLFRRHSPRGMNLADLAALLNHPTWINDETIKVVDMIANTNPTGLNKDDTLFALSVLPVANEDTLVIKIGVSGKLDVQSFKNALMGNGLATIGKAMITGISGAENNIAQKRSMGWSGITTWGKPPATVAPAATTASNSATAPAAKPAQ